MVQDEVECAVWRIFIEDTIKLRLDLWKVTQTAIPTIFIRLFCVHAHVHIEISWPNCR